MFSSFMNPVAIYVGYFFSFSFVFLLPDVNDGNVIANNQVRKQSFSFELIDSSLAFVSNPLSSRIFFFFSPKTN
jgi:hypothetical protein